MSKTYLGKNAPVAMYTYEPTVTSANINLNNWRTYFTDSNGGYQWASSIDSVMESSRIYMNYIVEAPGDVYYTDNPVYRGIRIKTKYKLKSFTINGSVDNLCKTTFYILVNDEIIYQSEQHPGASASGTPLNFTYNTPINAGDIIYFKLECYRPTIGVTYDRTNCPFYFTTNWEQTPVLNGYETKEVARTVNKIYLGEGGVAKQIINGYIGVNGVAQKIFGGGSPSYLLFGNTQLTDRKLLLRYGNIPTGKLSVSAVNPIFNTLDTGTFTPYCACIFKNKLLLGGTDGTNGMVASIDISSAEWTKQSTWTYTTVTPKVYPNSYTTPVVVTSIAAGDSLCMLAMKYNANTYYTYVEPQKSTDGVTFERCAIEGTRQVSEYQGRSFEKIFCLNNLFWLTSGSSHLGNTVMCANGYDWITSGTGVLNETAYAGSSSYSGFEAVLFDMIEYKGYGYAYIDIMPGYKGDSKCVREILKFDPKSNYGIKKSIPLNLKSEISTTAVNNTSSLGNFYICGDYLCCGDYYTTDGDNWTKRTLPNEYGDYHGTSGFGLYENGYYYLFSGKCKDEISRMYVTTDFLKPGMAYPVKHIETIFKLPGGT